MVERKNLTVSYIASTITGMDKISQSMIRYGGYDWNIRTQITRCQKNGKLKEARTLRWEIILNEVCEKIRCRPSYSPFAPYPGE